MHWPLINRLPTLLFGSLGTLAEKEDPQGQAILRPFGARDIALLDDDREFQSRLGRRGLPPLRRYRTAAPLLLEARHAAGMGGEAPWDAVVVSVGLADMNGITALAQLKALFPKLPVWLALPMEEPHSLLAALCAGADGYLLKNEETLLLRQSLVALPTAEPPLGSGLARHLHALLTRFAPEDPTQPALFGFSAEQIEFLRVVAKRGSTLEAAAAMELDERQRSERVRSIYRQLRSPRCCGPLLSHMRQRAPSAS